MSKRLCLFFLLTAIPAGVSGEDTHKPRGGINPAMLSMDVGHA